LTQKGSSWRAAFCFLPIFEYANREDAVQNLVHTLQMMAKQINESVEFADQFMPMHHAAGDLVYFEG
jgi:hypothetical protein